jgi:ribosomal protein S12 methylthiotransferase accessory factor
MTQQLKRTKPYKAELPGITVNKIKNVLNGLGLHLVEKRTEGNSVFSASVLSIINPSNKQVIFSTFGKGNTADWASASAWGEMIERIQNLAFYMIFIYPSQSEPRITEKGEFTYFPDEKVIQQGNKAYNSFIHNYEAITGIKTDERNNDFKITGIPLYSVFDKKTEYFPFRALQVIAGSNGMCSGNTMEEALIQGISEIFERHVLKSIYLNPFCPPDIPLSRFHGTEIADKINQIIRLYSFKVIIKDCSLGKGYPVIGVLIKNNQNGYAFHLGADPNPITALERCFTELYQGGEICFQSIDELNNNLPYNLESDFWRINLSKTIRAYAGQWPPTILDRKPSYNFTGFKHTDSLSDHDDLICLFRILKDENRKVFIRDNSFLDQPAYFVFVPGMSEITNFYDNTFSTFYLNFDKFLPVITNLKKSTFSERSEMRKILPGYINSSPQKQFNTSEYFKFYQLHPVAQFTSEKFVDLINFSLLEGAILDHFDENEIKSVPFINSLYENDCNFNPSEIFHKLNFPYCFECDACKYRDKCNFPFILEVWERLKVRMKYASINQSNFLNLKDV